MFSGSYGLQKTKYNMEFFSLTMSSSSYFSVLNFSNKLYKQSWLFLDYGAMNVLKIGMVLQ